MQQAFFSSLIKIQSPKCMFRTAAERETDCDDSLNDDDAGQHSILSFF